MALATTYETLSDTARVYVDIGVEAINNGAAPETVCRDAMATIEDIDAKYRDGDPTTPEDAATSLAARFLIEHLRELGLIDAATL